jgi:SAM-dependent methyltransferase
MTHDKIVDYDTPALLSWEEAVRWLRDQPDQQELVRACYYDDPLLDAAQRFAGSEEWAATRALLPRVPNGAALDLGAGRGISSFALARDGWTVTALDPDPSALVGAGAIRALAAQTHLPIAVVEQIGEQLPFERERFDLVYGRQVLHHAQDLARLCREVWRVLKPGGVFVATREHVISDERDLDVFRASHPLHRLYGGENAFTLAAYRAAITQAAFRKVRSLGPCDSVINYFPISQSEQERSYRALLERMTGPSVVGLAWRAERVRRTLVWSIGKALSWRSTEPGRLFSFMAEK